MGNKRLKQRKNDSARNNNKKRRMKQPSFKPPSKRVIDGFLAKCSRAVPTKDHSISEKQLRQTRCVIWGGSYRRKRLKRGTSDQANAIGYPYCGKTCARHIAYFIATGEQELPSRTHNMHCRNDLCVNPWHIKWRGLDCRLT